MLEMKRSVPADWPACKALWQTAFGDDDTYIDNYYVNQYQPERVLLLKDEGGLRSMLALFPMQLRWPDGGVTGGAYLYALATDPAARGQGYATFLLRYADFCLAGEAVPFLTTVPARPELEPFFAASGFQNCHPIAEAVLPAPAPGPVPAAPVTGEEYRALREGLLADTPHAIYDRDYLDFQAKVSALAGGGLYRMETPGGPACAVAERGEKGLLEVKELLAPRGGQPSALAALTAALPGVTRCRVRCPAGSGELPGSAEKHFGMGKGIPSVQRPLGESYFGLAFD